MTVETSPLTREDLRDELRKELDRTLRHYATKADLAALETRITQALADQTAAHTSALAEQAAAHTSAMAELTTAMASQTRWLAGLVLAAAAVATSVVIAVDRLAG